MSKQILKYIQAAFLLLFLLIQPTFAVESTHTEEHGEAKEEKFDPGKFIFGHIRDGYYWHITEAFGHDLSLPLPVIVKAQSGSWHVFMSSKFEHGHANYQGFEISKSKEHLDKIVEMVDGKEVRPFDLSITKNVASLLIAAFIICAIFLSISKIYKRDPMKAPGGFQAMMEVLVLFIVNEVVKPGIGKGYEKYVPYLLTLFFFILINNVMGLIPIIGGANVTGNIAVTMVLAVCTFIVVNLFATKDYWHEIFWSPDVPLWLKAPIPLIPFLEFIGIFTKPIALMVRLFANILAGHIILLVFISLIFVFGSISPLVGSSVSIFSMAFAIIMNLLEVLVVFIQAYVFTLLSASFIGLAKVEAHHAKAHH